MVGLEGKIPFNLCYIPMIGAFFSYYLFYPMGYPLVNEQFAIKAMASNGHRNR